MKQATTIFLLALICTLASLVFAGDMTVKKADDFVKQNLYRHTELLSQVEGPNGLLEDLLNRLRDQRDGGVVTMRTPFGLHDV